MNRLKRYCSALHRYKRSKGFGVHSPFAFNFILRVLRERNPYYAYDTIHSRRYRVKKLVTAGHSRIISYKNAKLLFRVTCYFSPDTILQIGTSYGISTTAMLGVSQNSRLVIYSADNCHKDIYSDITEPYRTRIFSYDRLEAAAAYYSNANSGKPYFVLINDASENNADAIMSIIHEAFAGNGTVIVRNMSKSCVTRQLWRDARSAMEYGMSFSNGDMGIIVSRCKLPLQHFLLWF